MECLHLLQHGVWKCIHVLCKVEKNISFQNKTLLVMFYWQNKTFWYQFCNFKHLLKAENSEDSLASSCEEFCISFHVTQYKTGLLLELSLASSCVEFAIGLSCNPVWDWVTVGTSLVGHDIIFD